MIRRVAWAVGLVAAVNAVGTLGYMLIERWNAFDAFYMTVITVGTVGFGEVHPLDAAGRVFTIFIIFAGVGSLAFAIGQFIEFLLEGHLTNILEVRRMEKRLSELTGHTIVAGLGRVGSVAARALADDGAPFVVVDSGAEAAQIAEEAGWIAVHGDATEEDVLIRAGVQRASSVITALSGDAENLFVTMSARSLNPGAFIVARSAHETTEAKLMKAGANRVITPNVIGGRRMASMVLHPTVADYLELVSGSSGVGFRLQEVELAAASRYAGQSLAEARIRESTGAQVVAILNPDGTVDANPTAATLLSPGQRLVVLGSADQVAVLTEQACKL
ncbi:MAG: potassium channel protein [Coriobacteriia bacterium]|nr:potassium channel protein [Coriobacteriia bacterium]